MTEPKPTALSDDQMDLALQTFISLCRTSTFTEAGNFIRRLHATDEYAPGLLRGRLEAAHLNPSEIPLYQGLLDSLYND